MRYLLTTISLCFFFISCAPRPVKIERSNQYAQNFKTDVAWVAIEWNGRPGGWGSAFLVDKNRGIFLTNKHVGDRFNVYGRGSHKIFFNGRVYNAKIIKLPQVRDAALVQITDKFEVSNFADPRPLIKHNFKVGEKITIEGFHVHPYRIRQIHSSNKYNEKIVPIFRDYYNLGTTNLDNEQEIVYEIIKAKIIDSGKVFNLEGESFDMVNEVRNRVNTYVVARAEHDHSFSLAGLSGTIVRNEMGETVGIVTLEIEHHRVVKEDPETGIQLLEQLFDTIGITPIKSISDLIDYIN